MSALWTSDEIAAATGGTPSAGFDVSGVTFDSREVGPGDLFVAMPGTVHDGHDFLDAAFAAGATAALVSQVVEQPHVLVEDVFAAPVSALPSFDTAVVVQALSARAGRLEK